MEVVRRISHGECLFCGRQLAVDERFCRVCGCAMSAAPIPTGKPYAVKWRLFLAVALLAVVAAWTGYRVRVWLHPMSAPMQTSPADTIAGAVDLAEESTGVISQESVDPIQDASQAEFKAPVPMPVQSTIMKREPASAESNSSQPSK